MKKIVHYLIIFLIVSGSIKPVFAENSVREGLTLEQALRVAFANNPKIIEARKEISASKGRWIQAEALPDPELDLSVGGFKKNEEGVRNRKLDNVSIKQPLDPLGTRFLGARIAHDSVNIARGELDITWAEVRKEVIGLYSQILANKKAEEIAQENLNAVRQFFTRVETRFQSGNALRSDVIRAKIEVSRTENELLIAQKNFKVSIGQMNLALGRYVDTPLALAEVLSYEPLRYEYEKIKEDAAKRRADVRNEKTLLSSRSKGLWSAVLKTFFPKMAIGIERTTEDYENDTSLILQASYPLWGFNLGQVKEAKAEKEKQKVRLEALIRQVGLEVYRGFLDAELADNQVNLQKKALEESNELLRQITLQYEGGEVPFLAYLENIKTIKETRLAYYNALRNYQEQVAELERIIQATPIPEGAKA